MNLNKLCMYITEGKYTSTLLQYNKILVLYFVNINLYMNH